MKFLLYSLGNILVSLAEVYVWHNIAHEHFNIKNKRNILKVLLLSLLIILIYYFISDFIKGFLTLILAVFFCKSIMQASIKKSIIISFIGQLTIIISEGIVFLFLYLIFKIDAYATSDSYYMILFLNLLVIILSLLISKISFVNKLYKKLMDITNNLKLHQIFIFILFIALGSNIFTTSVYFNDNFVLKLILNIVVSSIYTIIVILVFNYQSQYYKINYKYKMSLEDLKVQENLINDYRIINHENKNQLLTIKSMTNNQKVQGYIDSLIKSKYKLKNQIINDSLKFPQGGIRGLLYSKLLIMKENNIKYYLNVDRKINYKIMNYISNDKVVDICNILGVFLDNAIEESNNKDDGLINIDFHLSGYEMIVHISNKTSIKSLKNLKSTKGKDRGYGLQLVKMIIEKNSDLENEREITKDLFIQRLIVKLK